MTTYEVHRNHNVPLTFDGDLLADVTSATDTSDRWTECRVYRTDTGRYVTEMVGRTTVPGETDRVNVNVYDDPAQVRNGFTRTRSHGPKKGEKYLTVIAEQAIEKAAASDPALQAALSERI